LRQRRQGVPVGLKSEGWNENQEVGLCRQPIDISTCLVLIYEIDKKRPIK
jgi:hypothetical protein